MKNITDGSFYNPTSGNLNFENVIKEIARWIGEKPDKKYEITVGCDSSSQKEPNFPLAVVILRKGEGGRFFLKKVRYKNKLFFNLHQRILEEVLLSCELALVLREELKEKVKNLAYQFNYIHADVGENGATKDMIKEVTGLIRGNGFEPKIKPYSFAASVVADRFS
jgi:uncharacterized protein